MPEDEADPPPANEASEPVVFGHFQVPCLPDGGLWELGRGAMGVTYRAFDTSLRTEVALKVIHADKVADECARRRFQREARAAASLAHPNVARVLYLGEQGGEFFYAMEFVAGRSLEQLLREAAGPLPIAVAVALAAQAAAGLSAAHRREVLHRDLKPANLMLLEGDALDHEDERTKAAGDRQLKVIDFGLARAFGERRAEESHVTQTVAGFIGTPLYASPEQCRQEETIDGRSDLYSLGVIIWEMLVGAPPFTGRTISVLAKHIDAPPPLERLANLPAPLADMLAGLLEKDPNTRSPQTAGELRGELDGILHTLLAPPPRALQPTTPKPTRYVPLINAKPSHPKVDRPPMPEPARYAPPPLLEALPTPLPPPPPAVHPLSWWAGLFMLMAAALAATLWMTGKVGWQQASLIPAPTPMAPRQNFRNAVGAEMVWINAGVFAMGSPTYEAGRSDDEKWHLVTLTRGYWIGKYEVTQALYQEVTGSNPSAFKDAGANAPVENVSWDDAKAFCEKLNTREQAAGRLPPGYRYGLPTEAQWEYACRAGTDGAFGIGDGRSLSSKQANFDGNYPYGDAPKGPNLRKTMAVGSYEPNAWGLYDMHGNVAEWCEDWKDAGYPAGSATDPKGPTVGSQHVFRGGDWSDSPSRARAASRLGGRPNFRDEHRGFRLALVPSGQ